jgi:hypothetical protein
MVMGGGLYIARITVQIITRPVICHGIYDAFCDTGSHKHLWSLSILGDFWD